MTTTTETSTTEKLIRVKIFFYDYDGRKVNDYYIGYFTSLEEAAKAGWKYEVAE